MPRRSGSASGMGIQHPLNAGDRSPSLRKYWLVHPRVFASISELRSVSQNILDAVDAVDEVSAQTATINEAAKALLGSNTETNTVIGELDKLVSGYKLSAD